MPHPTEQPLSLIETQFPVARLSAEAYKERMSVAGQTLTGLGKWWGRKPLVLVRAVILGLLLPATDDPRADGETLLRLLTMDDEGLWRRKDKAIPRAALLRELRRMPPSVQRRYLDPAAPPEQPALRRLAAEESQALQRAVFERLPYSEQLRYCCRPEQVAGPSPEAWAAINRHLGTRATDLPGLVQELGERRCGRRPRVGDAFCGGGSVPFEAARLGCDAYGSDLNPVAALLTWAALHIVGGGKEAAREVEEAQEKVFRALDAQMRDWGIEHNERGWRADAYLYCAEAVCPEPDCGWRVPLAPAWVIATKTNVVAELVPDEAARRFEIVIREGASREGMRRARAAGTVGASRLACPHCGRSTPIASLRRDLRPWEAADLVPRPDDVFQERLYCIRWVETYYERYRGGEVVETLTAQQARALPDFGALRAARVLRRRTRRHYLAPTRADLEREERVLDLLQERLADWQKRGYLPSRRIEPGDETSRLHRERGWTHWHHLFTPRQLLTCGTLARAAQEGRCARELLPLIGRMANVNSKLSRWLPQQGGGIGGNTEVYYNQALNPLYDWAGRTVSTLATARVRFDAEQTSAGSREATVSDARSVARTRDFWI
ncbi:MAG: DUF1156 domain-containing protein, partial [Chloroflexi bacterium]|nr:DUF1156 domain-containing protein [Chloroflexota bacterium]